MNDPHSELLQSFVKVFKSTGMSGQAFADHIGISQQQWSAVLRGDRNIGGETIAAMARAYPVEVGPDILRFFMSRQTRRKRKAEEVAHGS